MIKKCIGCGLILQDSNKNELGYTPTLKNDYCMRCFRLKNYGETKPQEKVNEEKIISKVNKSSAFSFFLIDYLNINNYTLNIFKKLKTKKVLVISKIDTLRRDMKFDKITSWLKSEYNINEDILYVSSKNNYGVGSILNYLKKHNQREAYILGVTNAGKSSLLNKMRDDKKEIVVSAKPNTTLDFIKIHIEDYIIYDTPGFSYPNLDSKLLNKEIKPITYNVKEDTTIVVNDNYSLYFNYPTSVSLYLNDCDSVKRKYTKLNGEVINVNKNEDIVLPGLGFINVKEPGEVILNNKKYVEIRNSISGLYYE